MEVLDFFIGVIAISDVDDVLDVLLILEVSSLSIGRED